MQLCTIVLVLCTCLRGDVLVPALDCNDLAVDAFHPVNSTRLLVIPNRAKTICPFDHGDKPPVNPSMHVSDVCQEHKRALLQLSADWHHTTQDLFTVKLKLCTKQSQSN